MTRRNVLAVDGDGAGLNVVQAEEELDQRALPRAARPDEADFLAGRNLQTEIGKDVGADIVGEIDMAEGDVAARDVEERRAGFILDLLLHGDRLHPLLHLADGFEQAGDDVAHPPGDVLQLHRHRQDHRGVAGR